MKIILLPLAKIKPYKNNPRINAPAVDAVAASIREFGFRQPIVVDAAHVIVAGHTRWLAAKQLRLKTVPVHVARDLSPAQVRAYRLADNRSAELAPWDFSKLAAELDSLDADLKSALAALDFDTLLAQAPADPKPGLTDPDDVPAPPVKPITMPGDLWLLGEHRLLCGDSTKAEDVARLMGEEKADFIFTDPPYGHNNNDGDLIHHREKALGKPQSKSSAARPIANDSPEEAARVYSAFLRLANDLLRGGGCCCCCGGGGPDPQFARWSLEMDTIIGFKHAVVWDKGGLGMGWHYRRNYEFVLVAEKSGGKCHWFGGTDVPNVIRDIGKIIPSAEQHPTEKPAALAAFFVKLHSQTGEIVFDPFLGSGTTMIAAEQLGRRCVGIEIEPRYVDVAVKRWENFTGKKAARETEAQVAKSKSRKVESK